MARVNISIPLRTASQNGFYIHPEANGRQLLDYAVRMRIQEPYAYLELLNVPAELAAGVLDKVRAIVPWAALRLDFGITTAEGQLQTVDQPIFDGQLATAYPAHLTPRPIRVSSNHCGEEADLRLFSALVEGAQIDRLAGPAPRRELQLACEMFSSVDFEASYNAQFLTLISILEIMAKPAPRPKPCLDIIDDAMARIMSEAGSVTDPTLRKALLDMHKGAVHWKDESIRSSIRRLAFDTSSALGDENPAASGKAAVDLYDKRSLVVHQGKIASVKEARDARQLVREVLGVAVGHYDHIRERFPLN